HVQHEARHAKRETKLSKLCFGHKASLAPAGDAISASDNR
ncbi:MAG: hypothetical protein RLZ36_625, partial [Pseudomonadota bacterium]